MVVQPRLISVALIIIPCATTPATAATFMFFNNFFLTIIFFTCPNQELSY